MAWKGDRTAARCWMRGKYSNTGRLLTQIKPVPGCSTTRAPPVLRWPVAQERLAVSTTRSTGCLAFLDKGDRSSSSASINTPASRASSFCSVCSFLTSSARSGEGPAASCGDYKREESTQIRASGWNNRCSVLHTCSLVLLVKNPRAVGARRNHLRAVIMLTRVDGH